MRELALQEPDSASLTGSWLRQGQGGWHEDRSARGLALLAVCEAPAGLDRNVSEEEAREAVARFDLLSGLIISERKPGGYYPNAAEFGERLVEPVGGEGMAG